MESKGPRLFFRGWICLCLFRQHQELETVLKGRLHQAVSLAQVGEANRWPKIKDLAEDVLQQLGAKKCIYGCFHKYWYPKMDGL